MAFYGRSYVTFTDGLDVQFVNNSADAEGGAIYVDYLLDYNQLYSQSSVIMLTSLERHLTFQLSSLEIGLGLLED